MPNMTLSLPDEVYAVVKSHREVRWSEIARRAIEEYAARLVVLDKVTRKGKLTKKAIRRLERG